MPRPAVIALAAAAALASAGCGTSACQSFGEKLCSCQPGMTQDACKTQVQNELNQAGVDRVGFDGMLDHVAAGTPIRYEDFCQQRLDACTAAQQAAGATDFCEFLLTQTGKDACGLTPANPAP
ncbi:MAG TPA: hypothetical protein VF841_02040 [Anaeromyxobacter sp.]